MSSSFWHVVRRRLRGLVSCALVIPVLTAGLVGCGGRSVPELVPVHGRLTLDGKPLAGKGVFLSPDGGTPGNGSQGRSGEDGSFEVAAVIGGSVKILKGARPGSYRVIVTDIEEFREDGTPLPPSGSAKARVPNKYLAADTSPLRIEVVRDMPAVTLDLKSK